MGKRNISLSTSRRLLRLQHHSVRYIEPKHQPATYHPICSISTTRGGGSDCVNLPVLGRILLRTQLHVKLRSKSGTGSELESFCLNMVGATPAKPHPPKKTPIIWSCVCLAPQTAPAIQFFPPNFTPPRPVPVVTAHYLQLARLFVHIHLLHFPGSTTGLSLSRIYTNYSATNSPDVSCAALQPQSEPVQHRLHTVLYLRPCSTGLKVP